MVITRATRLFGPCALALAAAGMLVFAGCIGDDEVTVPVATPAATTSSAPVVGNGTLTPTATVTTNRPGQAAPTGTPRAGTGTVGRGTPLAAVTPAADTPNPCTLVTMAEAETSLGGRPFPASLRRSSDSAEVRCTYELLASGEARAVAVGVWKGTEAKAVYELRRSAYVSAAEDMAGLGDRAFVVRGDEGWINILKGDIYLSVQVDHPSLSEQDQRARALSVARTAVGRL
jgi:hypothetical protein